MADAMMASVAGLMNRLPEVRWDRCVLGEMDGSAFGWIDRDDGRADFIVLFWATRFDPLCPFDFGWTTSSTRYSAEFSRRLRGTDEGHRGCERVEDVFGVRVVNKVALAGREGG